MFALMCWSLRDAGRNEVCVSLNDVQADEWHHVFEINKDSVPVIETSAADGGLFCIPWKRRNAKGHSQIVVVNPLTRRKMKLPPLLSMGVEESDVRVKVAQLTIDRKTEEYKVHVVGYMKIGGEGLFAQVYDSRINGWSVLESREGRIIGWEHTDHFLKTIGPCVYNCADGNVQQFNPSDIAPGLTVKPNCKKLINDHLFVLHKEATPGSTNLVQESVSGKYCISEFHLPEKATAWVKFRVHECDPSMYDSPEEILRRGLSLLACNGFLLELSKEYERDYDRVWLYSLSACAWRNIPEMELSRLQNLVLCEISWSALP